MRGVRLMEAFLGSGVRNAMPVQAASLPAALTDLDPSSRAIVDLSFRHRMSPGEIAQIVGLDADQVVELRDAALVQVAEAIGLASGGDLGRLRAMLLNPPGRFTRSGHPPPSDPLTDDDARVAAARRLGVIATIGTAALMLA